MQLKNTSTISVQDKFSQDCGNAWQRRTNVTRIQMPNKIESDDSDAMTGTLLSKKKGVEPLNELKQRILILKQKKLKAKKKVAG